MMQLKPLLSVLVLALGVLGFVICGAGIAAAWSVGNRLARTNEKVFDGIDQSLAAVRERILGAQQHIGESKITTVDIEESLRNWARLETNERLELRLEVEEKSERLVQVLRQASQWLELSDASFQGIQQALEVASSLGAQVDTTSFDTLLENLTRLRSQVEHATESVDGIRARAADTTEDATREDRIEQAVQLALRVVVTFGEMDAHLGEFADKISETQAK